MVTHSWSLDMVRDWGGGGGALPALTVSHGFHEFPEEHCIVNRTLLNAWFVIDLLVFTNLCFFAFLYFASTLNFAGVDWSDIIISPNMQKK